MNHEYVMSYIAPAKDMLCDIEHLARIDRTAKLPGFEDASLDTAQAVLEECAKSIRTSSRR